MTIGQKLSPLVLGRRKEQRDYHKMMKEGWTGVPRGGKIRRPLNHSLIGERAVWNTKGRKERRRTAQSGGGLLATQNKRGQGRDETGKRDIYIP